MNALEQQTILHEAWVLTSLLEVSLDRVERLAKACHGRDPAARERAIDAAGVIRDATERVVALQKWVEGARLSPGP